jgi:hypothetical protein
MNDPWIASNSQENAMFYVSKNTFDQSIHLKMSGMLAWPIGWE